ncbi:GDP-mannose 4,6-dehydratase, partial [Candidatus Uhrbacteria bacterium]|nr:GDP-mannose 4,6-dehydratase [Candidatus Uhrbacteria bacterium]
FHLAAHIDDRESVVKPVENAEDNILGPLNVFEAARLVNVKKIIFASTGILYGNVDQVPTSEDATPRPMTPYGVSKLTGERYLHFYWLLYKLPYVAMRIGNLYGPRQDASKECGVIAISTKRLLDGQPVFVHNDGKTTRDYVYVGDVVDAMLLAAVDDSVGVFNIATGVETTTEAVLALVSGALGAAPAVERKPDVQDMVKRVALDVGKAAKELGWRPATALADGVAKTVAWYKARG